MSYQVKDYMTKEVNTIDCDVNITEAAIAMAADEKKEGYVICLVKGKPVGIVANIDIVNKVVAKKLNPSKTRVAEVMSTPLVTVDPDDDLLKASGLMKERNVSRLGVVRDDVIYGVITANNIAQRCGEYVDRSVRDIIRWSAPLGV
jgi:signal-transduction protein with cAMP-binding, CBS, and nucleotidyltransferase domain